MTEAAPGAMRLPPGLRTAAVLHLPEASGPSRIMRPRLERLAGHGALEVVVPSLDGAARSYADLASTTELPYEALTFPSGARALARVASRRVREVGAFRHYLRRSRPDLLVVATAVLPAALVAARLERVPTIVEVMEVFDAGPLRTGGRRPAGAALLRLHRSLADALVCCSRRVAAQFGPRGRARVETIYPGVAPAAAGDGRAFRARLGLGPDAPLIAAVGNVTVGRGQDLLIRAMVRIGAHHPAATCVVVGATQPRGADREYRAGLERLAREQGVAGRVAFTDFVEQIADVYAAADVVVNPARFPEPFGRVAPEALLAGCPVVAANVGGVPEVLADGRDALLVRPEDPDALAGSILRLLEDHELVAQLVEAGRARILSEFSEERGADAFERLAAEVLAAAA